MQSKLKHLFCLFALAIFICIGLASESFLDESTNVSVKLKPSDCGARPPFTGTLTVTITNNTPIGGFPWQIEVFLSNQKINDTTECLSFYQHSIKTSLFLLSSSSQTVETPTYTHDNKGDLWRVQVRGKVYGTDDWAYNQTKVVFYNQNQLSFTLASLPSL